MPIRPRQAARWLQVTLLSLANKVAPRRAIAVVHGYPFTEGNAVEMVGALRRRYGGRVVWLVDDVDRARLWSTSCGVDLGGVEVMPHRSLRGMVAYVSAEVVCFTHGLYGDLAPSRRTTIVNLWHGDGFKANSLSKAGGGARYRADVLVRSTTWLNDLRSRELVMPIEDIVVVGSPRTDQFYREVDLDLRVLGLPPERPFVLWMPTFRKSRAIGLTVGNDDVASSDTSASQLRDGMVRATEILAAAGISLVIKPHPLDVETFGTPGLNTITNDQLVDEGVQLYELMGRAAALVTDYSSAWVDYLVLDRPIGFVVPDEAEYAGGRGLAVSDALDWLPGPRVETDDDWRAFARAVIDIDDAGATRRAEVRRHIGLATSTTVADDLVDALDARGAFARSGGARPRGQISSL